MTSIAMSTWDELVLCDTVYRAAAEEKIRHGWEVHLVTVHFIVDSTVRTFHTNQVEQQQLFLVIGLLSHACLLGVARTFCHQLQYVDVKSYEPLLVTHFIEILLEITNVPSIISGVVWYGSSWWEVTTRRWPSCYKLPMFHLFLLSGIIAVYGSWSFTVRNDKDLEPNGSFVWVRSCF